MTIGLTERPAPKTPRPARIKPSLRRSPWLPLLCLVIVLVVNLPLFICMGLDSDPLFYDVCAQSLLRGGVQYRDALEHGLPGMTWIHAWLRPLIGWGSEPLRRVDVGVVGGAMALLVLWLYLLGRPPKALLWSAVLLTGFYFSTSEWSHCQRDVWILLPAMLALLLRRTQVMRLTRPHPGVGVVVLLAVAEGVVWGAAVWLKPFILLPAACTWLVSALWLLQDARRPGRWWALFTLDALGMVAGGAAVGAVGIRYLVRTGAWPYFLDVMRHWNPEYYRFAREQGWTLDRIYEVGRGLFPWVLVHILAVPLALVLLGRLFVQRGQAELQTSRRLEQALLAALYLGWFVQAAFLQNLLEYIHVAPILLGLAVVVAAGPTVRIRLLRRLSCRWRALWPGQAGVWSVRRLRRAWVGLVAGFAALALVYHPMFQLHRLGYWARCWYQGSTPEIRDGLTLVDHIDWQDLRHVGDWFQLNHHRGDGEITCWSNGTHAIYPRLQTRPSTRYVFLDTWLAAFPGHRDEILRAVRQSKQRYVVTDLRTLGFGRVRGDVARNLQTFDEILPKEVRTQFPWTEPIAFRVGLYTIHEVRRPQMSVHGFAAPAWSPGSSRLKPGLQPSLPDRAR